jgi:predicted nuclease with RNAse H fold
MLWYGTDPGGANRFGVAALGEDGTYKAWCGSSVDEVLTTITAPIAVGIDCPLWWSSGTGGGRRVDRWLRHTYGIHAGTVQSVNSLRGSVLVQGMMLAIRLRERMHDVQISETHPKALLQALGLSRASWEEMAAYFALNGPDPANEHQRDAVISAVVAREGATRRWTRDLSVEVKRDASEIDPKGLWFGPVAYWWPNDGKPHVSAT